MRRIFPKNTVVILLSAMLGFLHVPALAAWPDRPITLVVGWVMGGATDIVARVLASGLEKELGVPVSVLNLEGAEGMFAHNAVAYAEPDGYTLGLATPDLLEAYWENRSSYSFEKFTPIAMVEYSPAAIWVQQQSNWRNLGEWLAAVRKASPKTYTMSGVTVGGAYHIALAALLKAHKIGPDSFKTIPMPGAMSGLTALGERHIDMCPNTLADGSVLMYQKKIRPLAVLSETRLSAFPEVPTAKEAAGRPVKGGVWRIFVGPDRLAPEIVQKLTEASERIVRSDAYQTEMSFRGYSPEFQKGAELTTFLSQEHARWGELSAELGVRRRAR